MHSTMLQEPRLPSVGDCLTCSSTDEEPKADLSSISSVEDEDDVIHKKITTLLSGVEELKYVCRQRHDEQRTKKERNSTQEKSKICKCRTEKNDSINTLKIENDRLKDALVKKEQENHNILQKLENLVRVQKRLQRELQRLARICNTDSEDNHSNDIIDVSDPCSPDSLTEDELAAMKLQLKVWESEASASIKDADKYRIRIAQVTKELEDAKQTIKQLQEKVLQYSQVFSTTTPSRIVLPQAPRTRRVVRSLPASPHEKIPVAATTYCPQPLTGTILYTQAQEFYPSHRLFDPDSILNTSDVISRSPPPYSEAIYDNYNHRVLTRRSSDTYDGRRRDLS